MIYEIYTDGSFHPKTRRGGYASYCSTTGEIVHGNAQNTTNNRMELIAVIASLCKLADGTNVIIYSDSQYFVRAIADGWLENWYKNNWKKSDGSDVLNRDLWKVLLYECDRLQLDARWVKGHSGHPLNELCDSVAQYNSRY